MHHKGRITVLLAVAFFTASAAALAAPARLASGFKTAETLSGPVDMRVEGGAVLVSFAGQDRAFRVELQGDPGLPASFHSDSARILYWKGHLVVMAPAEGKAFHFSIAGLPSAQANATDQDREARPHVWNLDEILSSDYDLALISTATMILSREVPAAAFQPKDDYQDYNPSSGGGGGCATSCSITCVGGTSCSVSCSAPTCAHCSCPASCSCS